VEQAHRDKVTLEQMKALVAVALVAVALVAQHRAQPVEQAQQIQSVDHRLHTQLAEMVTEQPAAGMFQLIQQQTAEAVEMQVGTLMEHEAQLVLL
jgi:hypothetical protein